MLLVPAGQLAVQAFSACAGDGPLLGGALHKLLATVFPL